MFLLRFEKHRRCRYTFLRHQKITRRNKIFPHFYYFKILKSNSISLTQNRVYSQYKTFRVVLDENLIEICSSSLDSLSISRVSQSQSINCSIILWVFSISQGLSGSAAKLGFFIKFPGSVQSLVFWSIRTYLGDYSVVGLYLFAVFLGLLQN